MFYSTLSVTQAPADSEVLCIIIVIERASRRGITGRYHGSMHFFDFDLAGTVASESSLASGRHSPY